MTCLILIVYALSLAQYLLLKSGKKQDKSNLTDKLTTFNFEEVTTKINYAKAKLILTLAIGFLYLIGAPIANFLWKLAYP